VARGMYEMDRIRREMENFSEGSPTWSPTMAGVHPLVNVSEDKNAFHVQAELPGLCAEDIEISVEGQSLTLAASARSPNCLKTSDSIAGSVASHPSAG
jgi:HSP20 family protein